MLLRASCARGPGTGPGSNGDSDNGLFTAWGLGNQHFLDRPGMQLVEGGGFAGVGHLGEAYGLMSVFAADLERQNGMVVLVGGVALVVLGVFFLARGVRGANACRIAVHRPNGGRRVIVLAVLAVPLVMCSGGCTGLDTWASGSYGVPTVASVPQTPGAVTMTPGPVPTINSTTGAVQPAVEFVDRGALFVKVLVVLARIAHRIAFVF